MAWRRIVNVGADGDEIAPLTVYSNGVAVQASAWDLSLTFMRTAVAGLDGEEQRMDRSVVAQVTMSPHHAKALSLILDETLNNWETRFGALPDLRDLASLDAKPPEAAQ